MPRPLECPFCNNLLARPVDIKFEAMEFTGGICICRSVYVFDRSGHNLGEIFLDALTFLCRGDMDKAMSMDTGEYETADFDYDLHANTVGRRSKAGKTGKLLFARLKCITDDDEGRLV